MYIVGHCLSIIDSGYCLKTEMDEVGGVATMLPDILDNHGWGYAACFNWPADTELTRFIRPHMLGDWFVHFGTNTQLQERVGWAYEQMRYFADLYESFFSQAYARGHTSNPVPTDSRRGFAHTMSEYSVDLLLSRCGRFDPYFAQVRTGLSRLARDEDDGVGSIHWLRASIDREKMTTSLRQVAGQVESFRFRAASSQRPEDFVVFSIMRKLALSFDDATRQFVHSVLEGGITGIGKSQIEKHYAECCDFIREHMSVA